MWIASVANIDWPAAPGLSADRLRADFVGQLDHCRAIGLNAVFVQIRPTADAFWPSPFEPWSQWLTGTQGQDPGWDPLAFMVDAAHERGLAFHAWFNPYRVAIQPDRAKLLPSHPARRHPDWTVRYGGGLYYNPGVPAARRFVERAMMDAVTRYEIDGVHFDDYFYPYPVAGQDFPDDDAFASYGAEFTDRAAWRRHNVDLLVREMRDLVRAARPEAAFGVSPFGVWRNVRSDPAGSDTSARAESYDALYADTRSWIRNGWLDYVAPQLYWYIGYAPADYRVLATWWAEQTAGTDTQLWIGQAVYHVGAPEQPAPWQDPAELSRHLALDDALPQIGGTILFSATDVRADRLGAIRKLAAEHWQRPVLGPLLPRLATGPVPSRPTVGLVSDDQGRARLMFQHAAGESPFQYAVHRSDTATGTAVLIAVVPGGTDSLALPGAGPAWYTVAAVDRAGRLGPTSPPVALQS
ncbi:uncharacterized lipoprotein YddW (UPF0748 family) [Kitasatospora sp. GAS1066B]